MKGLETILIGDVSSKTCFWNQVSDKPNKESTSAAGKGVVSKPVNVRLSEYVQVASAQRLSVDSVRRPSSKEKVANVSQFWLQVCANIL